MKSHKGKPKPQTGLGFPQRLREREREREIEREKKKTAPTNIPITKEKEREDYKHQSEQGAGLKGHQTKQHFDPRDQKCHTNNPNIYPKNPEQKTTHKSDKVSEELSQQRGRAHGPPCTFGQSPQGTAVPRGTSTPPLRCTGTAPGGAKTNNYPNTRRLPQKLGHST